MSKKSKSQTSLNKVFKLPEREAILIFLREAQRPQKRKQFAEAFAIRDPETRRALGRRLKAMERDGQLIRNRRGSYGLIEKMDLIKGRVIGHSDGYGFVAPDEGGKDLYLSGKEMRSILNGDRVLVRQVSVDKQGKREGALVEILERANTQLVGRYYKDDGIAYVVPDNKRINQNLLVPPNNKNKAKHGQYVVAKIVHQPGKYRQPIGEILSVIGDGLDTNMAVSIAIRSYDLPFEWSKGVDNEIVGLTEKVDSNNISDRIDYRDIPFVTIDGEDARDFDDAVFCQKNDNKKEISWRLLVAIADVSNYVKKESELDDEARLRGTSVYFPDRVIPMLPEVLSNGLCSLKPHVDRYSLVCELNIDNSDRILIKKNLKDYANINKDVVITCFLNKIEIWAAEEYGDLLEDEPMEFADLAEDVMGNINV